MTCQNKDLTADLARRLLRYDPSTGKLYWRSRTPEMFSHCKSPHGVCKMWNTRYAETEAFMPVDSGGYKIGTIFCRHLKAHRVIWLIETGKWPVNIDHINGVRTDNRWGNLREVTFSENMKNKRINKNNTSGVTGVFLNKTTNKWTASIGYKGRRLILGTFEDKQDAIIARRKAEVENNYHKNHGDRRADHF